MAAALWFYVDLLSFYFGRIQFRLYFKVNAKHTREDDLQKTLMNVKVKLCCPLCQRLQYLSCACACAKVFLRELDIREAIQCSIFVSGHLRYCSQNAVYFPPKPTMQTHLLNQQITKKKEFLFQAIHATSQLVLTGQCILTRHVIPRGMMGSDTAVDAPRAA